MTKKHDARAPVPTTSEEEIPRDSEGRYILAPKHEEMLREFYAADQPSARRHLTDGV